MRPAKQKVNKTTFTAKKYGKAIRRQLKNRRRKVSAKAIANL